MVSAQSALDLTSITRRYALCGHCLARQLPPKRAVRSASGKKCQICEGLMNETNSLLELILNSLKKYKFETFLVGAVIPQRMLESEDAIRARFKIRGRENLKSDLTKKLGKMLSSVTGKNVDYLRPDVTIKVDVANRHVDVRSRPIYLFGRYVKKLRGLKQKQDRCAECKGGGCPQCNNTGLSGFDSVEGVITRQLVKMFGCDGAKFSWVGGEDKESLVLNEGRPFFVKVVNPRKRRGSAYKTSPNDGVHAKFTKVVEKLPDKPLKFRVRADVTVECENSVDADALERLRQLDNSTVKFAGKKNRIVSKKIYEFTARASGNMLEVSMTADGGLTIKQFVHGDGFEPSISQVVGCKATCKKFDVLAVDLE